MSRHAITLGFSLLTVLHSPQALAGCDNDLECKGDRICESGECVDPSGGTERSEGEAIRFEPVPIPSSRPEQPIRFINADAFEVRGQVVSWEQIKPALLRSSESRRELKKGQIRRTAGWILFGIGSGAVVTGVAVSTTITCGTTVCWFNWDVGLPIAVGGGIAMAASIPIIIVGNDARRRAANEFGRLSFMHRKGTTSVQFAGRF